ncbi:cyclin-domain-containing protein [Cutaneotrichosporon oleaginosum]|uniref:Cyclin-domain-containing protein n=1 Tax=Cutaneotrichosporon oleaginosum TaxID=879819 RepID=A0A0J0XHQ3_9TREE|nr:cyclin-domain-containing protein [Cutaneotrichosporon oleaginosum]KLT40650.1 cyclin-domain-containing protein [Cutaneotrichosporon oleaginosum]TXT12460.1 hypothetical protein COLE_02870 [Cutaneotrichosporon oleaginosum]
MTTQRGGPSPAPASPVAAASPRPELPWAFIDCPTETLVVLIAHMLELLCQHNDQVLLTPDALTRFHSRAPPGITIIDYLRRIVKYTNLEKIPLLSLLAYIDLTCQNLPTFTLSSLTVHRFLIAGVTAGSKAQCDVFCTNAHYAKVGGIKVGELNSLEREFLRVTAWALCCNADLLQRYYTSLIRSHGGFVQAPEPEVSPFMAFPDAGKAPQSEPDTPANSAKDEAEADGSELGSVDEGDEDDEVEEDEDVDVIEVPPPPAQGRGRPRQRDAMDVDPPEPKRGRSADKGNGLKQLVGGLFHRRDRSHSQDPTPTPPKAMAGQAHDPPSAATSATVTPSSVRGNGNGHTVRSRPVASPALDHSSPPKQLTPRVRTRDERSVESLRGVGMPPPVAVDDCKRRARGD